MMFFKMFYNILFSKLLFKNSTPLFHLFRCKITFIFAFSKKKMLSNGVRIEIFLLFGVARILNFLLLLQLHCHIRHCSTKHINNQLKTQ